MINQRPFGRRSRPQQQPLRARPKLDLRVPATKSIVADVSADQSLLSHKEIAFPYVDNELPEWEQPPKWRLKMPWRQLALMASLCFGIASFVLPDSINDELEWFLYGLTAMSLYAGVSRRLPQS
jgi:hypothetical protein